MDYKELIEKNIKEFDGGFVKEFINDHNGEWRPLRGLWMEDIFEYIHKYQKQFFISYLEEENKRLKGEYVEGTDDRPTTYNKAIREQIKHNLQVITYLKEL